MHNGQVRYIQLLFFTQSIAYRRTLIRTLLSLKSPQYAENTLTIYPIFISDVIFRIHSVKNPAIGGFFDFPCVTHGTLLNKILRSNLLHLLIFLLS